MAQVGSTVCALLIHTLLNHLGNLNKQNNRKRPLDSQLTFYVFVQAERILANLIVMGSEILGRAVLHCVWHLQVSFHCVSVWKCSVYGRFFLFSYHYNLAFMKFVYSLNSLN